MTELSGRTVQYGYDDLYRLTSETIAGATSQNATIGYTYDPVCNRQQITSTVNAIPSSGLLNYDANDRTATDTYDNNGNTVAQAGIANVYDFENHLVQHGAMTIVYDGDGNRVAETVGGQTTKYQVDDQNFTGYAQVVEELQNGQVVRKYSYGLERISENQLISGTWKISFYDYDGHGSVRALTNNIGVVTDTYDYDAFGNLLSSTGTTSNTYLFAGESYDSALGMYFNRARYYQPTNGRFLTMDTFEGNDDDPSTLHKYLYANNNAVNNIDPSGNDSIAEISIAFSIGSTIASMPTLQAQQYIGNTPNPDIEIRKNIADIARSNVGSHNWLDSPGANKCNIFVFDVLTKAGHAPPKLGGTFGYYFGYKLGISSLLRYAPVAGQWADTTIDIPSWPVVSGGPSAAQPGDIIAEQINYSDASGHVGIVVGDKQTASADSTVRPPGTITITDYGFRPDNDKRPHGHAIHSIVRRFTSKPQ